MANGKQMRMWKGHVLESLHDFLNASGMKIPKNWNVKSKCAADPIEEERKLEDQFERMHRTMLRKTKWTGKTVCMPSVRGRAMKEALAEMTALEEKIPAVKKVREMKEAVKNFPVCPVDKQAGEAVLVCPKC